MYALEWAERRLPSTTNSFLSGKLSEAASCSMADLQETGGVNTETGHCLPRLHPAHTTAVNGRDACSTSGAQGGTQGVGSLRPYLPEGPVRQGCVRVEQRRNDLQQPTKQGGVSAVASAVQTHPWPCSVQDCTSSARLVGLLAASHALPPPHPNPLQLLTVGYTVTTKSCTASRKAQRYSPT